MPLKHQFSLSALVCAFFSLSGANPVHIHEPCPNVGRSVNTTSGTVVGHSSSQYPQVGEYLGIPFAEPPLGSLRFNPPKPYIGNGTITANKQPRSCIQAPQGINYTQPANWQQLSVSHGSFANYTSEDCLYLNVWNKPTDPNAGLKPVMVWFYGGGFHLGGISDSDEQGGVFVYENDVVFVSFNYRLGIFGFSGAPGLTQNVAFLDQRLAIEWVRDNAEAFGGDPQKIMIFGHSAGGSGVDYYDFAWLDDPIIAASSPMSGGVDHFGRRFPNTTAAGWYETAALIGCGNHSTTDDSTIVKCLQSKPANDVLRISENATKIVAAELDSTSRVYVGITGLFGPTIDNKTVFANYTDRAAEGKIIRKPSLIGDNILEGCFFAEEGQIPVSDEAQVTEAVFTCPAVWDAVWRANQSIPVWKYSWEGTFRPDGDQEDTRANNSKLGTYPNTYAPACPGKPWHGLEVYIMFNATEAGTGQRATAEEVAAGAYMRKAWSTFARDPTMGLSSQLHWPTFNSNESNIVQLAHTNGTGFKVANAVSRDALCFTKFGKSMFFEGSLCSRCADQLVIVSGAPNF